MTYPLTMIRELETKLMPAVAKGAVIFVLPYSNSRVFIPTQTPHTNSPMQIIPRPIIPIQIFPYKLSHTNRPRPVNRLLRSALSASGRSPTVGYPR